MHCGSVIWYSDSRGRQQLLLFDEPPRLEVHLQVGPEVAVEHAPALVVPEAVGDGVAAAQQAADVIVAPDVEDDVLGSVIGSLLPEHPAVRLVDAVAAHAEVPDRLAQVARQVLLPGLAVADLVALREAVAVGVDAALPAGVHERSAGTVGLDGRDRGASVHAV